MNIFLISNMYPSKDNPGYGVFVKNVTQGLADNGINTSFMAVIAGRGKGYCEKIIKYIVFYWNIVRFYFKPFDFVYCHFPTFSAPILYLLMHINKRKLVINFHGEDLLYQEESNLQQLLGYVSDKLTKKFATLVIVPSEYYKEIAIQRGLISRNRIFVSPSGGINTNLFTAKQKCFNGDSIAIHLGYVGRLEELKGIKEFVNACKVLNEKIPFKATIIGYGPLSMWVKKEIEGLNYFELIEGVEQVKLPEYYRSFDLFVFPSKRKCESLGLVGIEALSCGTPVIGSNIGGIVSYLHHGENGFVARIDHLTEDIVDYALYYSQMNSKMKINMIDRGKEVAANYGHEFVCKSLASLFKTNFKK